MGETVNLSIIIAARNETYLRQTVEDVLAHTSDQTEIIVLCDGALPVEPLARHARVNVVLLPESIGQRAAVNLGARLSNARYICKLDAHVSISDGFDVELIRAGDALGHNVTQIPRQYHLHVFNWRCQGCGTETYQGNEPTACEACAAKHTQGGPFERVWLWERRQRSWRTSSAQPNGRFIFSDFWRFDSTLHFQYHPEMNSRPEAQGTICDTMSALGACFFMRRERFLELGGLDEAGGTWGQFAVEVALKSTLSGGRHVVNKGAWFAHLFRTRGGDFGFPYPLTGDQVEHARAYSRRLWLNNAWPQQVRTLRSYVDQFWPVPGWTEAQRQALPTTLNSECAA